MLQAASTSDQRVVVSLGGFEFETIPSHLLRIEHITSVSVSREGMTKCKGVIPSGTENNRHFAFSVHEEYDYVYCAKRALLAPADLERIGKAYEDSNGNFSELSKEYQDLIAELDQIDERSRGEFLKGEFVGECEAMKRTHNILHRLYFLEDQMVMKTDGT